MFKKLNFTVKESKNIRHSDRKAILPESINACFNSKQQFSQLKVAFPNGPIYRVFTHENEPVFFQRPEDSKILYPSVYFLWRHPNKFPVIRIHSSVFTFLQKGSDLMIPGILLDDFPEFQMNSPVAIAIIDDENDEHVCFGPVAVGKALTSSIDMKAMRLTGKKGKAIEILHIFGDHLWAFGSKKELPRMQTVNDVDEDSVDDGHVRDKDDEQIDGQEPQQQQRPSGDQENCEDILDSTGEMDQLLENTFFSAIRWKMEQVEEGNIAPVDAGQFYANFILKNLPPGRRLEIKKTRYKKFSNFLRQINSNPNGWVVQLKTVKGIDSIERINFEHPFIKQAAPLAEKEQPEATKATTSSIDSLNPFLTIHEQMFSLTEQSIPLFRPAGHRKGDLIDLNRIRFVLMDYAEKQNLVKDAGKSIELDDQLQIIFKHFLPDKFPVNTLVQKLSSAMTKTLLVQTRDGQQFVHRGKVPSIEIKIEKRSGNKLVTLVSNLASYGIDAKMLDKEIKGTGTSVLQSVPGCDGPQLLVQGNEVNKIGKLLHDLGLPNKFIKGLELGIKEKKKKK